MQTFVRTYHVEIHNGNASSEVVFVVDSLKFVIEQSRAFLETRSPPRVKGATLKLDNTKRCFRALLFMKLMKVCRQPVRSPVRRVTTVESEGIIVVAVDVHLAAARAWCIVAVWCNVIVDHGHENAGAAGLVDHVLHVLSVGERAIDAAAVLVFWLEEYNGTAVGNLMLCDDGAYVLHVTGKVSIR